VALALIALALGRIDESFARARRPTHSASRS
jgi:hypothetical protein